MDIEDLVRAHKPQSLELEIFRERSSESSLFCLNGAISSKEGREFEGFGIRVCDSSGRVGFSYCQSESEIPRSIGRASSMLASSSPCAGYSFPVSAQHMQKPAWLEGAAEKIRDMDANAAISLFQDFIASCQGEGTVALEGNFSAEYYEHSIANSNGLAASSSGGSVSAFMQTKFNDNSAYAIYSGQTIGDFAAGARKEGEKSRLLAREIAGASGLPSGRYNALFELPALHSLVSEILLPSFAGDSLLQKSSILSGKLGQAVFSPLLSMYDDPADSRGFFSAFDGEGVSASKKPLVRDGAVAGFLLDSRSSGLLGAQGGGTMGNCARSSFQSMPGCGESNIVIEPPAASYSGSALGGEHVEVHSFHGTHTANTTTGDFSVISDLAFWCNPKSGGAKRIPVKNVMITGNVFRLFSDFLTVDKNQGRFLNLISPRIMFGNIEIVGSS